MKTFFGMEVEQDNTGISLHLDHYIQTVLSEYQTVLSEYTEYIKKSLRPKKVPISPGVVLHPDQVPAVPDKLKQKHYRSFVAKLQFAATWIRMNISFTVSQLARFCASAGTAQSAALHHLMEYLEGNPSFKITYRRSYGKTNLLSGYADSDWGNSSSRRSTSGMIMLYNKSPISWKSKMQKTMVLSTA